MTEKRRCPNCGAFLSAGDSKCYVCGAVSDATSSSADDKVVYEPEAGNDFVTPVTHDDMPNVSFEDRMPFSEEDYAEPYEDEDEEKPGKNGGSKKVLIICIIVVAVALIVGGVFAFKSGIFDKKEEHAQSASDTYSVYFDKPSESLSLFDAEQKEYRWSGDVEVTYTLNGKSKSKSCSIHNAYANLWECELPKGADNISFGNPEKTVKTVVIEDPIDGAVYFVTDNIIGADGLDVDFCDIREFRNDRGINYISETDETETKTEEPTEETDSESETESETEVVTTTEKTDANYYSITIPDAWRDGSVDIVTDDEKTVYYDNYNHEVYGSGMLLAVYLYDANDSSYKEKKYNKVLKSADGSKIIVVVTPSDMEFVETDRKSMDVYGSLSAYTNQVINSIKAK